MRKENFEIVTIRIDSTTAKVLKTIRRGGRAPLLKELLTTNPKVVRRYTAKKAA